MGIGEELTKRVINQAAKEGCRDLLLIVEEENERAYNLYKKLGFRRTSIPGLDEHLEKSYRLFGRRSVIMRKDFAIKL